MARKQKSTEETEPAGPGKVIARVAGGVGGLVLVTVVFTLLMIALGNVTGGWRIAVAGLMGLAIAKIGIGYFAYLTNPPPPDPEPMRVDPQLRLSYVCEMCGLELAVVAVAKERAPKHCGEAMVLVRREE
ncbi:MAG TPA: hypothetical protein VFV09_06130 [Actinomycetota bacterium]|jgi:hypothetical protein|nr:hypothetical protein [Actinomycetota bacterium]